MERLEKGKTYEVKHRRKGTFSIQMLEDDGEWVRGTIVQGQADAKLAENTLLLGDPVQVKKTFCVFKEVKE